MLEIRSPLAASVVEVLVEVGRPVRAGAVIAIVEAMKMEHEVRAPQAGEVAQVRVAAGDVVDDGEVLVVLVALAAAAAGEA
ncbi:MAG: acetyl-CoA carboxylase biotin carboxyl carrier protein subunit, partial [Caldimonas sp.]